MKRIDLNVLSDALIAWLPFAAVLVLLPVGIYDANQLDFSFDTHILRPFLLAGALSFIAVLVLRALNWPRLNAALYGLFFVGAFLLVSDALFPVQLGLLDGSEKLTTSVRVGLAQLVLALIVAAAALRLPRPAVTRFAAPLVLFVIGTQLAFHALTVKAQPMHAAAARETVAAPAQARPNIYHFVFDGFSSLIFEDVARKASLDDDLTGFTFFRNTMSNYLFTDASVPSFMTGRLFKGGSFKEFQLDAKAGGFRRDLEDAGYTISAYVPNRSRFWMYDGAKYTFTSENVINNDWTRLAQIVLLRAAPELLRTRVHRASKRLFGAERAGYSYYKRLSVPLMQRFLADEAQRPPTGQYIYVHLILPHAPFVWSASDCRFAEATSYRSQAECAARLMGDVIARLHELGRYGQSLVIFQSDHGWHEGFAEKPRFKPASPDVIDKVRQTQTYFTPEQFFARVASLLLVKPPGAAELPLQISDTVTQLVDVPPTIRDLIGLPPQPSDGQSVFAAGDVPREAQVFAGIFTRDANNNPLILGQNLDEMPLGHLSYSEDAGWSVHEDVMAEHEGW